MPLLDLLLSMFWFFLFFAWIWLVITVFIDIFRSSDLSGWGKAGWAIFVLVIQRTRRRLDESLTRDDRFSPPAKDQPSSPWHFSSLCQLR